MGLLSAALDFFERDIMTIPIQPRSKLPLIRWQQYQTIQPQFADLISWFSEGDKNIAVLCGVVSNNLCILDFDSLPAYFEHLNEYPQFEESFTVSSARGMHIYLFVNELPQKTFRCGECDVKSSGYCLTYPSVHPTGVRYEVMNDAPIARIETLSECGMTPSTLTGSSTSAPVVVNNYGHIEQLNITAGDTTINNCTRRPSGATVIAKVKSVYHITDLFPLVKTTGDGKGFARCPMPAHPNKDRDPSLSLDLINDRCQCLRDNCPLRTRNGNDYIDAYSILHGLSFKDTLSELAAKLGRDYGE